MYGMSFPFRIGLHTCCFEVIEMPSVPKHFGVLQYKKKYCKNCAGYGECCNEFDSIDKVMDRIVKCAAIEHYLRDF